MILLHLNLTKNEGNRENKNIEIYYNILTNQNEFRFIFSYFFITIYLLMNN